MALAGFPMPSANSVTVEVGGATSGPTRIYVDLDAGVRLFGYAGGGDGAGIATKDLPVSSRVVLSADDTMRLRAMVAEVTATGLQQDQLCSPNADSIVVMALAFAGRSMSGELNCPSKAAARLLDAVFEVPTSGAR